MKKKKINFDFFQIHIIKNVSPNQTWFKWAFKKKIIVKTKY